MSDNYLVMGTNNDGHEVWYAEDYNSGYPFASPSDGKSTTDLQEAISWLPTCLNGYAKMNNPRVVTRVYEAVDISANIAMNNKMDALINRLSDEEILVLTKRWADAR